MGLLSQQFSTIFPSNKVHHTASPEVYGALEQPPLNRGSTPSLESSNKVHPLLTNSPKSRLESFFGAIEQSAPFFQHLSHFWLHLQGSQLFCSIFEDFINMVKLNAWLWYHVKNHEPSQWYDIVPFEHKLVLVFPKDLIAMVMVFLTYKLMINPLISRRSSPTILVHFLSLFTEAL